MPGVPVTLKLKTGQTWQTRFRGRSYGKKNNSHRTALEAACVIFVEENGDGPGVRLVRRPTPWCGGVSATAESVGIDDPITLGGRQTTLRIEHGLGKVALVRGNLMVQPRQPLAHWALVRKDWESVEQFRISAADFKLLNGRS